MHQYILIFLVLLVIENVWSGHLDPTRLPSKCEVCKFLVTELKVRLTETGKSKEVLETGHGLETKKKRFKYSTSELRLTEALHEPHICHKILEYNVHAERDGSNRYAKGRSQTMETLHGLVDKGVKVTMDIPYELWDEPSAEVSVMQRQCFTMLEEFEEDIEEWYYNKQDEDLTNYICAERVLSKTDKDCLSETFSPDEDKSDAKESEEPEAESEDKKKKDKKSKNKKEGKDKKKKKGPKGDTGKKDQKVKEEL